MKRSKLLSDHLLEWSDRYEKTVYRVLEAKAKGSGPAVALDAGCPARVLDRTLQAMWKARLSVCAGAWAWTQILSFRKPIWRIPSGRLRSRGLPQTGPTVPGELSGDQGNPKGDFRHQFRTSPPQRALVGNKDVLRDSDRHRCERGSHGRGQYAWRLSTDSTRGDFEHGGER